MIATKVTRVEMSSLSQTIFTGTQHVYGVYLCNGHTSNAYVTFADADGVDLFTLCSNRQDMSPFSADWVTDNGLVATIDGSVPGANAAVSVMVLHANEVSAS